MTIDADVKLNFARAIRSWRKRHGITQEELAERSDLHRTYISDVERGARNLSLESINKLARALEVSVSTLFASPDDQRLEPGMAPPAAGAREFLEILLVEDDLHDVAMTLDAFGKARFANRVQVVHDGAEALAILLGNGGHSHGSDAGQPQMILLDLNLPKMSGLEVLRRLRADDRTRDLPVVILTGSQQAQDIMECRTLGVTAYLTKPVDMQRLSEVTPQLSLNWMLFKPTPAPQQGLRA